MAAGAAMDHRPPRPCCGGRMIIVESFDAAANRALRRRPRPRSEPRHHDIRLTTPPGCRGASLPALHHCRPAGSKATCYTVDHANIAPSAAAAATNRLPRSSVRRRPRQPAHPLPKPSPRQIPINGYRPPNVPRVPSWEAFGRRPSARADSHERPASETLHQRRHPSLVRGSSGWGGRGSSGDPTFCNRASAVLWASPPPYFGSR